MQMGRSILVAATLGLAALSLSACAGADGDLDGDLEVGGTEPAYWTVQVQRETGKANISILGEPAFEGELPVKTSGADGAFLMASKTPQGDFVMTFTHKECFDGLAETARPWTVTVDWKGEKLLGCATPVEPAVSAG